MAALPERSSHRLLWALWLSGDDAEHASGRHAGTAEYTGELFHCCRTSSNDAQSRSITSRPLKRVRSVTSRRSFWHVGVERSEDGEPHRSAGSTISCAAATGVAFSSCLLGTSCGGSAAVSLSVLVASAISNRYPAATSGTTLMPNTISCALATAGSTCTTPAFNGTCPIGTSPNGSGLCCFSSGGTNSAIQLSRVVA